MAHSFSILKEPSLVLPFVIPELTKCFFPKHLCYQLGELIKSLYTPEFTGMLKDKICLLSLSSMLSAQQSKS